MDISFRDFLSGHSYGLSRCLKRLESTVKSLSAVNLGGTIVGRVEDVPQAYWANIIPTLNCLLVDCHCQVHKSDNLFDAAPKED